MSKPLSDNELCASAAGGLNIEGKQVDACINNGTDCGLPAADAFCKYIGFDGATEDMEKTAPANEPVRAVTGAELLLISCSRCLAWYCRVRVKLHSDGSGSICTINRQRFSPAKVHAAGEWCVSEGNYQMLGALNRTQFDDLATVNANNQHCNRLSSATCYRRRETMSKVFDQLQANATKPAVVQTPVQVRKRPFNFAATAFTLSI